MNKDLTTGKPAGVLLRFTLPMLLSVAFQQLYNIADSVIAGKFAGEDALAAVGASYPVTMIFMAVAFGMNIGISVVISQLFGAKDFKEMKTAAYTGFISVAVLGVVLTVVGTVLCEPILRMLGTPENIMEDTTLYLAIYIWGLLFLFIYNISSGVFTSLGDSKTPLWFLIASSVGNIVLDAVFVIIFHWGVGGVAWATFLAQGVASACAFWAVLRRLKSIETKEKPALFSGAMLRRISIVAIPSILQQSFVSVGNLCIQGLVNGFGSSAIAGYSAGVKLNTFATTSLTALNNSVSSFTGQNIGAGKMERVRSGFKAGLVISFAVALVFMGAYVFCGEGEARQILAKYYFCGAAVMKRVSSLSGGEKVLLKLAVLLQNRVNFLILDEPTNHIDIETREMLEDALLEFSGTLLFISHDRYFIDKLATKIVVLENRKINVFDGTYADYLRVTGHA